MIKMINNDSILFSLPNDWEIFQVNMDFVDFKVHIEKSWVSGMLIKLDSDLVNE